MNANFKELIEQTLDMKDYTEEEFKNESETTQYLLGRMIVDNSDMLEEIHSYNLTKEEILKIREGLLYSFDNEFGLINTELEIKNAILNK